jgi:F-type H+-transporting ATPase subunit alpha
MIDDHLIVTGKIESLQDGIFICSGLNQCFVGEVIAFGNMLSELRGIVMDITQSIVKIVHLSGDFKKGKVGDIAYRTYHSFTTIAGFGVLGLALSILGECLNVEDLSKDDFSKHLLSLEMIPVSAKAPSITMREPVRVPAYTGITSIDTLIPVGKGQRELLIGDKGVGKTTLALTIILNQRRFNNVAYWRQCERVADYYGYSRNFVPCFYVTIGQRRVEVARIKNLLIKSNAMYYTCIVYAGCDAPAAVQYMAPYTACAMGEWFRGKSYSAIIVYDDLTQHAIAYRQMSLLLRRPPGREAYPGDIFYIHSKLLERSAQLSNILGGGALTAFPVIETKSGDISAYIPTNVISITDGQIFLSKEIMNKGIRPAVNLNLSVSRVGAAAQVPSMAYVSKFLKRQYSMYKRYEGIDRLGGDIDSYVMDYIIRGRNIDRYFIQRSYKTRKSFYSIVPIFLLCSGLLDSISSLWITGYIKFILNKKVISFFSNRVNIDFILNIPALESFIESEPFYLFESTIKELSEVTPNIFNRLIRSLNDIEGSKYYFNKLMY